jgi:N-6 DNA Methylase/ORF6N domain
LNYPRAQGFEAEKRLNFMQCIAPSEKDTATDTLEKRLWDALQAERRILLIRQHRVMLDYDLAALYGVESRALKQAVRRNLDRFPADFMFELASDEVAALVSQNVIPGRGKLGGARPMAFTEQGVAMLSSVLRSPRAVQVNIPTQVIEPYHGRILDPACGSGGMFVSSARFVSEHKRFPSPPLEERVGERRPNTTAYSGDPSRELSIHGVEKTDETGRLCRLNLAVQGLEGEIKHGGNINSYYDDPHDATGRFDFVLVNPPFNVNALDKARLKDSVGPGRRFPFGLPRTDNANYLWIQLFHSALNEKGRAGFVMANGARSGHSYSMKFTEDVRKYAAEPGIAEEEALKRGMEEKSKEFVEKGAEVYAKA